MLHTLTESKSISVLQGCGSALLENPDPDPTFGKIKIRNPSLRKKSRSGKNRVSNLWYYDNLFENSSFLANQKCVHNFITLILCLHQVFPDSDLHFPGSGSDQIENIRIQLYPDPRHCCIPTLYSMNQSLQRSALIIFITNDVRYWNYSLLHSYCAKFTQNILYVWALLSFRFCCSQFCWNEVLLRKGWTIDTSLY